MRGYVPFPTYTTPFILATWGVFFIGRAAGLLSAGTGYGPLIPDLPAGFLVDSAAHGVSQVMFQASIWTALFFLVGIAVNDRRHATWVLLGSIVGMALAGYHVDAAARSLDPERLIERAQFDNIQLGLYGYNATLVAVALFLWRRSVVPPLLGILFSVPLTELVPRLGLPALTAPFVLAAWLVILLGWLEKRFLSDAVADGDLIRTFCLFLDAWTWRLANETHTSRTGQIDDFRGCASGPRTQKAGLEAEPPGSHRPDHGRTDGNGSRRQDRGRDHECRP